MGAPLRIVVMNLLGAMGVYSPCAPVIPYPCIASCCCSKVKQAPVANERPRKNIERVYIYMYMHMYMYMYT